MYVCSFARTLSRDENIKSKYTFTAFNSVRILSVEFSEL